MSEPDVLAIARLFIERVGCDCDPQLALVHEDPTHVRVEASHSDDCAIWSSSRSRRVADAWCN